MNRRRTDRTPERQTGGGPDLDALDMEAAEKVMGWDLLLIRTHWSVQARAHVKVWLWCNDGGTVMDPEEWSPTRRIEHAWMLLDKHGWWEVFRTELGEFGCNVSRRGADFGEREMIFGGYCDTASLAITLAALAAVESER